MLQIEQAIAFDIMGEQIERTEEEILNDEEALIEKSDLTAMGVAVPDVLVTEGDDQPNSAIPVHTDARMREEDFLLETAGKSGSLVEFMQLEQNIKMSTMKSIEGGQAFAGDSFQVDGLADSVGTELTEILDGSKPRQ